MLSIFCIMLLPHALQLEWHLSGYGWMDGWKDRGVMYM